MTLRCVLALTLEYKAMHIADFCNDVRFNRLVQIRKNLKRHEVLDELKGLETEFLGQRLYGDRRLNVEDFLPRHFCAGYFGLGLLVGGNFFCRN